MRATGYRLLDYAQQYIDAIDWSDIDGARRMRERTGAFADSEDAKLRLPKYAS